MIETRTKVTAYEITAECNCGGTLESTGKVFNTYPPKYPHKCLDCGKEETLSYLYPYIKYE